MKAVIIDVVLLTLLIFSWQPNWAIDQNRINEISNRVAQYRQLKFKKPIIAANQSTADFSRYMKDLVERSEVKKIEQYRVEILSTIGLYRGVKTNVNQLAQSFMQSQAAAYYDPDTKIFNLLMPNLPRNVLEYTFAHELMHGLQDQYYDLNSFLLRRVKNDLLNDEILARKSVIEGEASFIATYYLLAMNMNGEPDEQTLAMAIKTQANLDSEAIATIIKMQLNSIKNTELKASLQSLKDFPLYLTETMLGSYFKGMAFVKAARDNGQRFLNFMYVYPPDSSEHILHPQKWLNGESHYRYRWPRILDHSAMKDWQIVEKNNIGELLLQVLFKNFRFSKAEALRNSAGWDGDSYIVLRNSKTKEFGLLLYTSWDSDEDAQQFHQAYKRVLQQKFSDKNKYSLIKKNRHVYSIENLPSEIASVFIDVTKIRPIRKSLL